MLHNWTHFSINKRTESNFFNENKFKPRLTKLLFVNVLLSRCRFLLAVLVFYFQLWSPMASIAKQIIQSNWPLNHSYLGGAKRARAFVERSKQLGEGISAGTKKGWRCKKMAWRRGSTVHWSPLFINDVFPRMIPHLMPYIFDSSLIIWGKFHI